MSALDDFVREVSDMAAKLRDENRPQMTQVVDVVGNLLGKALSKVPEEAMHPAATGPERWSWITADGTRELSVSQSALEEAPGYPLLTMRQILCPPLDNQLTTSALVIGTTKETIAASVITLLTNHAAAVSGISAISGKNILSDDITKELDRIEGRNQIEVESEVLDGRARFGKDDDTTN